MRPLSKHGVYRRVQQRLFGVKTLVAEYPLNAHQIGIAAVKAKHIAAVSQFLMRWLHQVYMVDRFKFGCCFSL